MIYCYCLLLYILKLYAVGSVKLFFLHAEKEIIPLRILLFIKEVCHIPFDVLVLCCISELWPEEVLEEDVLVLTSS